MGLLLSILVSCVGVVELIAFYSDLRRGLRVVDPEDSDLESVTCNYRKMLNKEYREIFAEVNGNVVQKEIKTNFSLSLSPKTIFNSVDEPKAGSSLTNLDANLRMTQTQVINEKQTNQIEITEEVPFTKSPPGQKTNHSKTANITPSPTQEIANHILKPEACIHIDIANRALKFDITYAETSPNQADITNNDLKLEASDVEPLPVLDTDKHITNSKPLLIDDTTNHVPKFETTNMDPLPVKADIAKNTKLKVELLLEQEHTSHAIPPSIPVDTTNDILKQQTVNAKPLSLPIDTINNILEPEITKVSSIPVNAVKNTLTQETVNLRQSTIHEETINHVLKTDTSNPGTSAVHEKTLNVLNADTSNVETSSINLEQLSIHKETMNHVLEAETSNAETSSIHLGQSSIHEETINRVSKAETSNAETSSINHEPSAIHEETINHVLKGETSNAKISSILADPTDILKIDIKPSAFEKQAANCSLKFETINSQPTSMPTGSIEVETMNGKRSPEEEEITNYIPEVDINTLNQALVLEPPPMQIDTDSENISFHSSETGSAVPTEPESNIEQIINHFRLHDANIPENELIYVDGSNMFFDTSHEEVPSIVERIYFLEESETDPMYGGRLPIGIDENDFLFRSAHGEIPSLVERVYFVEESDIDHSRRSPFEIDEYNMFLDPNSEEVPAIIERIYLLEEPEIDPVHGGRSPSPFPTYERLAPRGSISSELLDNPTISVIEVDEEENSIGIYSNRRSRSKSRSPSPYRLSLSPIRKPKLRIQEQRRHRSMSPCKRRLEDDPTTYSQKRRRSKSSSDLCMTLMCRPESEFQLVIEDYWKRSPSPFEHLLTENTNEISQVIEEDIFSDDFKNSLDGVKSKNPNEERKREFKRKRNSRNRLSQSSLDSNTDSKENLHSVSLTEPTSEFGVAAQEEASSTLSNQNIKEMEVPREAAVTTTTSKEANIVEADTRRSAENSKPGSSKEGVKPEPFWVN